MQTFMLYGWIYALSCLDAVSVGRSPNRARIRRRRMRLRRRPWRPLRLRRPR